MGERKIDAIIWDLDGTLIDSDLYVVMNFVHMYQKYRPGYYPHLREMIGFSGPTIMETSVKQFPEKDPNECVNEFEDYSKHHQSDLITLYDGEMEAIRAIHDAGIKMILFTNKKGQSAVRCMESTGLISYIPTVISLDDVSKGKPDPEGIYKALDVLGTSKDRTMIIGDSDTDIVSGARAGILTGLVTWSLKGLPGEYRDYEFDTFEEIKEFAIDGKYTR